MPEKEVENEDQAAPNQRTPTLSSRIVDYERRAIARRKKPKRSFKDWLFHPTPRDFWTELGLWLAMVALVMIFDVMDFRKGLWIFLVAASGWILPVIRSVQFLLRMER